MLRLFIIFIWVFLSAGCALFGRSSGSEFSFKQLQTMGEKFLAARDFPQALKYLSMAEKERPKDPDVQYSLGLAYYERGLRTDALMHFKRALESKPDFPEAQNALGRYYAEQGQLDLAQQAFQKAIANPFYQTPQYALYNLGLVYEQKGDLDSALRQYQEAVRLDPCYGAAYYRLGQMLEHFRRGDDARAAYGKAIEYSPDLVEAQFRYGVMSYTIGEIESALYSLNRVVKLAPHSTMAEEARRYLDKLQAIVPPGGTAQKGGGSAGGRMDRIDVVKNEEFLNERVVAAVNAGSGSPDAQAATAGSSRQYIVQLGSFLDKENAELLQTRLQRKGHQAVVKPFRHQVLGDLFVVQLKPVRDPDEATRIMLQVEGEGHGKAIVIEVSGD
jgi:type IV pilus assembly protein PilF